jgi:hypothetical protein
MQVTVVLQHQEVWKHKKHPLGVIYCMHWCTLPKRSVVAALSGTATDVKLLALM